MVSSPMYNRLMEFANSAPDNEKLYGWDDEHSTIVQAIREARDRVEHFKEYQGFTGQAGQAMSDEATRAIKRFDKQANYYMTGMSYYVEARRAIMLAAEDARQLSPTLLDPMTESLRHAGMVTIPIASRLGLPGKFVNSLVVDGLAYVEGVEAQANAQREAKATEIIERFESTMNDLNTRLQSHTKQVSTVRRKVAVNGSRSPSFPKMLPMPSGRGTSLSHPTRVAPTVVRGQIPSATRACVERTRVCIRAATTRAERLTGESCSRRVFPTAISPRATWDHARTPSLTRRISWTWICCTPASTVIGTQTGSSEGTPPLPQLIAIIPCGGSMRHARRRHSTLDASAVRDYLGLARSACAGLRAWVDPA